jgi:hypothetical protein
MSGGGGGGGSTQYNWNDDMAPQWRNVLGDANNVYNTPYQAYQNGDPNALVAGISPDQSNAMNQIRAFTTDPTLGVKDPNTSLNDAQAQEQSTLSGNYLKGLGADPYANMTNSYTGLNSQPFNDTLNAGLGDIVNQYKLGTDADTTRMFNQAGAFGGSAYGNAVAANQYSLGKALGNYASGMQNDQLNRSAQLEEQEIGRGSQAFQNERNRQVGMVGSAQNEQPLALQRAQALMGVGDANRSYNQDLLNANYNTWQQQRQYPYTQLDYLTGILSRAQGGISPNMTTQQSGYGASPFSSLLGAGLTAYGLSQ